MRLRIGLPKSEGRGGRARRQVMPLSVQHSGVVRLKVRLRLLDQAPSYRDGAHPVAESRTVARRAVPPFSSTTHMGAQLPSWCREPDPPQRRVANRGTTCGEVARGRSPHSGALPAGVVHGAHATTVDRLRRHRGPAAPPDGVSTRQTGSIAAFSRRQQFRQVLRRRYRKTAEEVLAVVSRRCTAPRRTSIEEVESCCRKIT